MICLLRVVYRALLVRFPLSSIFYVRISRKVLCILSVICNFFFYVSCLLRKVSRAVIFLGSICYVGIARAVCFVFC